MPGIGEVKNKMKKLKFYHWLIVAFIGMVIVGFGIGYAVDRSKNKNIQGAQTQMNTSKADDTAGDNSAVNTVTDAPGNIQSGSTVNSKQTNSGNPTATSNTTGASSVTETGIKISVDDNFNIPKCAFTSPDYQYRSLPISLARTYSDGSIKPLSWNDATVSIDYQNLSLDTGKNLLSLGSGYQTYSSSYSNFPDFETSITVAYQQWSYTKKIHVLSTDNCSVATPLTSLSSYGTATVWARFDTSGRLTSSGCGNLTTQFIYSGGPSKTYLTLTTKSIEDESIASVPGNVYGFTIYRSGDTFVDYAYKGFTARQAVTFTKN